MPGGVSRPFRRNPFRHGNPEAIPTIQRCPNLPLSGQASARDRRRKLVADSRSPATHLCPARAGEEPRHLPVVSMCARSSASSGVRCQRKPPRSPHLSVSLHSKFNIQHSKFSTPHFRTPWKAINPTPIPSAARIPNSTVSLISFSRSKTTVSNEN